MVQERSLAYRIGIALNYFLLFALTVVCMLPILNVVAVSFSDYPAVAAGKVAIWPVNFSTLPYIRVFEDSRFIKSFSITVLRTLVGVFVNVFLTVITAYPLSRSFLKGRSLVMLMIAFTMIFSGGMIPTFLLVRSLGLIDSFWAFILPGAIGTFSLIVTKSYFETIPDSLEEAAKMDGASPFQILFQIFVPMSTPVLATITLFYAVFHWNAFFDAIIYINSESLKPLQVLLREIIFMNDPNMTNQFNFDTELVAGQSITAAAIVVATLPIVLVYPFLQRYFIHGITLGAVKE